VHAPLVLAERHVLAAKVVRPGVELRALILKYSVVSRS